MTLTMVPADLDEASADPGRDWAVIEIRPDGSLGRAQLVSASGPGEAVRGSRAEPDPLQPVLGSAALEASLGLLQAGAGHLTEAARSFSRGGRAPVGTPGRQACLGRLALVEAYRGDLRRAEAHARLVVASLDGDNGQGSMDGRLALAWIHLERAEDVACAVLLDRHPQVDTQRGSWLATARLLLEARLLVATGRPDTAVRLLTCASDEGQGTRRDWPSDVLRVARADAMLAAGEPHRALRLLTPLLPGAETESSVTTAGACLAIGDVRGADAVLRRVGEELDRAPLAVQLRAWLLQAHIADARGHPERGTRLVDRALHAASSEGLRNPVLHEWPWVRPLVDRHHALRRTHRDFLTSFRTTGGEGAGRGRGLQDAASEVLGAGLTERELQVLDLLSQMYSTEEIAAALYVSANTVKTHIKGIFGKLCVNRRVDAVRRGRSLGLC